MRYRWPGHAELAKAEWTADGPSILAPEVLKSIHDTLEDVGSILIIHWLYAGGSSPDRMIFSGYDEFLGYLNDKAFAGDIIDVWSFEAVCRDDNRLTFGKCPDENGLVPRKGPY